LNTSNKVVSGGLKSFMRLVDIWKYHALGDVRGALWL